MLVINGKVMGNESFPNKEKVIREVIGNFLEFDLFYESEE